MEVFNCIMNASCENSLRSVLALDESTGLMYLYLIRFLSGGISVSSIISRSIQVFYL